MFIISEISPQFGNDLDVAEQMILQSKIGGANAVKIQLYPTELYFKTPSNYLKSRELDFSSFKRLKDYGDKIGIPVFATAFDEERLEWCLEVEQKYFKIAARMHDESPALVSKIINTDKTVFVSIPHTYDLTNIEKKSNCIYFYCINQYPTLLEDVSLPDFNNSIFTGFSDHSLGIAAALLSISKGCKYLEKHYTISTSIQKSIEKGHLGSMTFELLTQLKRLSLEMELILDKQVFF